MLHPLWKVNTADGSVIRDSDARGVYLIGVVLKEKCSHVPPAAPCFSHMI